MTVRVSIRDVHKTYRTRRGEQPALGGISLDIDDGEFVVLLGPSGCGKSTLLRCIAGLEQPDRGEIDIGGTTVFSAARGVALPPEDRHLSMVFQSYALWPHMSVFDNVAYPLRSAGVIRPEIRSRTQDALRMVALEAFAEAYPGQLSGGQQQRVALARAMVSNSGLVLFDEPLSNLDAKVRERLRVELLALQRDIGFSAVYVTHDQTEALAMADRLVVMNVGHIAQIGAAAEIYLQPATRYVADFVGGTNEIPGSVLGWEDGLCFVRTAIGDMLGTPTPAVVEVAQGVTVLFRPEHCWIGTGENEPHRNRFTATLERSMFLGAQVEHVVKIGDTKLVLRSAEAASSPNGAEISFSMRPGQVRIFPAEPA